MKIAIFCAFDTPETIEYALATVSYLEKKGHELDLDSRLIEYISKPIDHTQFEASGTINLDIDFLFSIGATEHYFAQFHLLKILKSQF